MARDVHLPGSVKIFHCDHCGNLLFFENTQCVHCGHLLAFLPDQMLVGSLDRGAEDGCWVSPLPAAAGRAYRLCANYRDSQVCNWAVSANDDNPLCRSCRLTRVVPDLSVPGNQTALYRLEVAKRRVVYTLLTLGLPLDGIGGQPPLAFQLMADVQPGDPPILTGHSNGIVTVNIAEADDAERERRRTALGEPYRTLLGHMRHEVGHYYWSLLVAGDPDRLTCFRTAFGDERADYQQALQHHYESGAPSDWQERFVSAYASAHPWEDWAETWAHYLHMTDTLETAAACGMSLRPRRSDEPSLGRVPGDRPAPEASFDRLVESWFPITYLLNNLNRGLGVGDAYPFVLSAPAIEKLRFVHETIAAADCRSRPPVQVVQASPPVRNAPVSSDHVSSENVQRDQTA
jgi:hypothetical protein